MILYNRHTRQLGLIVVAVSHFLAGCDQSNGPALIISDGILDCGVIPATGDRKVFIPLHNSGDDVLSITDVVPSCSCVIVGKSQRIAPGEGARLSLVAPSGPPGRASASIMLKSNDPAGPKVVHLTWFNAFEPQIAPSQIDISAVAGESEIVKTVQLIACGTPSEVVVQELSTTNPEFELIRLDSGPTSGDMLDHSGSNLSRVSEIQLQFKTRLPKAGQQLLGECSIWVSVQGVRRNLVLPVKVEAAKSLEVQPNTIVFVGSSAGELLRQKRRIRLIAHKQIAPTVVDAPGFVECQIDEVTTGLGIDPHRREYVLACEIIRAPNVGKIAPIAVQLAGDEESLTMVELHIHELP